MFVAGMLAAAVWAGAGAAQSDICENKTGTELTRCIEAAARAGSGKEGGAGPPPAVPAHSQGEAPAPRTPRATGAQPIPDCSGREGEALRRCLAAGGRLSADAAVLAPSAQPAPIAKPATASGEACEAKSGEALRACIEHAAQTGAAPRNDALQLVRCTGYSTADQPLCVHRNSAIIACRNRARYPDLEVCLRGQMSAAPQPERADCSKTPAQARVHCEARNRVYAACRGDKMTYFTCLEQKLGEEALLPARAGK